MDLSKLFSENTPKEKKQWKELKPEPVLTPILEKCIIEYNEAKNQTSPTDFRGSEIGGCDRRWLYKQKHGKESIDWKSFIIMNVGTSIHELLQEYLADHLVSLEERVYFNIDAGDSSVNTILSGSYDGELDAKRFKEKTNGLLEIKTTGVNNYQRLLTNKAQLSNKYKLQNTMYLHAKGLEWSIFIFCNRNLQFTDEFKEEYKDRLDEFNPVFHEIKYYKDDALVQKIRQKITDRKLHYKLGTLPKREKTSECDYCSFRGICDEDNEREKVERREEKSAKTKQEKLNKKNGGIK